MTSHTQSHPRLARSILPCVVFALMGIFGPNTMAQKQQNIYGKLSPCDELFVPYHPTKEQQENYRRCKQNQWAKEWEAYQMQTKQDKSDTTAENIAFVMFLLLCVGVFVYERRKKYKIHYAKDLADTISPFPHTLESLEVSAGQARRLVQQTLPYTCARVLVLHNDVRQSGERSMIEDICNIVIIDSKGDLHEVEHLFILKKAQARAQRLAALLGVPYEFKEQWA